MKDEESLKKVFSNINSGLTLTTDQEVLQLKRQVEDVSKDASRQTEELTASFESLISSPMG